MQDDELVRILARQAGQPAAALAADLGVSQPTVSRALRRIGGALLVARQGRDVRYALRREVHDLPRELPIYEVGPEVRAIATLHLVAPRGCYVEAVTPDAGAGWFEDLPWFLNDLRPQGFIGRSIPARHPDLDHPTDVRLWSSDHVLRYLAMHGWDAPGAFVVGDRALSQLYASVDGMATPRRARERIWPALAADVLKVPAGSSAGGEHAKFLAKVDRDGVIVPVLVKFSPPRRGLLSARVADLLVAEHLAHRTLADAGIAAARSEIVLADDRVFLEVERFDRVASGGPWSARRGLVTLESVDAFHVGRLQSWTDSAEALRSWITEEDRRRIRWLSLFGRWIGNNDMHMGNLCFFLRGTILDGVAPAFDMLPMAWAPRAGELVDVAFAPDLPVPADAAIAEAVLDAAEALWARIASDERITPDFRGIAEGCGVALARLRPRLDWLPR